MKNKKQFTIGIIMLIVPVIFLVATGFDVDNLYLVPYIAITIMTVSGIVTIGKSFFTTVDESKPANGASIITNRELLLIITFLIVSILVMNVVGFYVTIFFMLFLIHFYIRKRNSTPNFLKSLLFAAIAWVIVFIVFGLILQLRVPTDVLLF